MTEKDESINYQFTKAGHDLAIQALAGTTQLDFTRAVTSTDNHFADTEADTLAITELANIKQTIDLKEVDAVDDDPSFVKVPVVINKAEMEEDYALLTIGLYCKPKDGDEVLYSVCAMQDPVYMHKSSNNSTYSIDLNTLVGSATNVTIKVDPAGMVTNATFDAFKATMGTQYALKSDLKNVALTDKANTFSEQQTLAGGAVDGKGRSVLFDGDVEVPSDVVRESKLNATELSGGTDLFKIYAKEKVTDYMVVSSSIAQSLVNCPTISAFTLTVKPVSYNAGVVNNVPTWNTRIMTLTESNTNGRQWLCILTTNGTGTQTIVKPWTQMVYADTLPDMTQYVLMTDATKLIAAAKQQAVDQIQPLIDAEMKKRNVPSYFWSGDATAYAAVTPKVADADYSVFE